MYIRSLGLFHAEGSTPDVRVLPAGKPLALLLYLALAPKRRARRSTLMSLLWDEPDERKLSNNFRQTLHQLRKVLPEDALVSSAGNELLELTVPVPVDALQFEQAVSDGRLDAAWACYDGHFLADFAAASEFDRWADDVRSRLRAEWLRAGEQLTAALLARDDAAGAVVLARRLRDDAPDRQASWRLLLEALLRAGQVVRAAGEADALRRALALAEEPLERETAALLQRLHATAATAPLADRTAPRRAETVGREQPLSRVLRAWTHATGGRGTALLLRAAAGVGKTRMLEDVCARLQLLGAPVISVRARPADRTLPFALAATLAEALAGVRGASGISSASASVLVGLAPALSNRFPAASALASKDGDGAADLPRTLAIAELIEVLAEESPLAILVDDLHYADADSRALLLRLGDRLAERRVLLVAATRPVAELSGSTELAMVELLPLSPEQMQAMLASLAVDEHDVLGRIAPALHAATDGNPLLVLVATELLAERELLTIAGEAWRCTSVDTVVETLRGGLVLEQLLRDVPAPAFRLLTACAAAGADLDDAVLHSLGGDDTPALLNDLAQRGLLQRGARGWEIAHDRIADTTLVVADRASLAQIRRTAAQALLSLPDTDADQLRCAARLLGDDHASDVARAFRRWLELTGTTQSWRQPSVAARAFLGVEAAPSQVQRLGATVTRDDRWRRGYPALFRLGAAAALLLAAVTSGLLLAPLLQPEAVRIVIEPIPNDNFFLFDRSSRCKSRNECRPNTFTLQATFRDDQDRLSSRAPRRAVATLHAESPMRLLGDTVASIINGRADFGEIRLDGKGEFRIEVRADGLPTATTDTLYAHGGSYGYVKLTGGTLNGQSLADTARVVHVRPGEFIEGSVALDMLTTLEEAVLLLGAVPTWGDRRSNFFPLSSLPSHGRTRRKLPLTNAFAPSRRLRAPTTPGVYRILLLAAAETDMQYIASGTQWVRGSAVWNDGNDAMDWAPGRLDSLDQQGRIMAERLAPERSSEDEHRPDADLSWSMAKVDVYGTTITIVVDPPAAGLRTASSAANPRPVPQQNPAAMRR